jgi:hypothetical protein
MAREFFEGHFYEKGYIVLKFLDKKCKRSILSENRLVDMLGFHPLGFHPYPFYHPGELPSVL